MIKAILIGWFITHSSIGLGPDEAQYWTWSQALDWGYYSKPPGIAYQIWLGTQLFGNTVVGVRCGSIVVAFFIALAVYHLARNCLLKRNTAFWAAVVMAFTPLGIMASLFSITDVGLVLFWTLACSVVAKALAKGKAPNYYILGLVILCGALFKWPIYLFWVFLIFFMPLYPYLVNRRIVGGVSISLLGLLPSVIWNSQHQWATFRHVWYTIRGGHAKEVGTTPLISGKFFDFIGAQASLLSPIIFILLLISFVGLWRYRKQIWPQLIFCGGLSLIILIIYSFISIFQKIQGNWCVFAYPSAIVFMCWYMCEWVSWGKKWLQIGVSLSVILCALVLSIPSIQENGFFSSYPIPYKFNPFRHNLGWNNLEDALHDADYDPNEHFLFGDKYQITSILSFYSEEQKRAYFLNLHGARKNQFSYWPSMAEEQMGKTGFFVLAENKSYFKKITNSRVQHYQEILKKYFDDIRFLGVKPIFTAYGEIAKAALIFKCIEYSGEEPLETELF